MEELQQRIEELEKENQQLENQLLDLRAEWDNEVEKYAKRCFIGGRISNSNRPINKAWLQFKTEEL